MASTSPAATQRSTSRWVLAKISGTSTRTAASVDTSKKRR
jgi:hypothetical protein